MQGVTMKWDRILVLPDDLPQKTEAGILIPDTVEVEIGPYRTGRVLATGTGLRGADGVPQGIMVGVGDRIVFHKKVGQPIVLNGTPYRIMGDRDAVAVVDDSVELAKVMARVPK